MKGFDCTADRVEKGIAGVDPGFFVDREGGVDVVCYVDDQLIVF